MEKLKLYTVTKPSTDGSFKIGDVIYLSENDDLINASEGGWISKDEWNVEEINDFEYKECTTHYLDVHNGEESVRRR